MVSINIKYILYIYIYIHTVYKAFNLKNWKNKIKTLCFFFCNSRVLASACQCINIQFFKLPQLHVYKFKNRNVLMYKLLFYN